MKKFLLLSTAAFMAAGAMAQLAPGEYYIKNVETGEFLNEGYSWGTHAVTKAYPCAFNITPNKPQEEGEWKVLGFEDNTTPFWSTWSEYVNLTGDGTLHYEFYNYTAGNNNWDNWAIVLTNGLNRGADGYHEYMYLRADAYGWGDEYTASENGHMDHNFNWDTFKTDMAGAFVTVDITRNGTNVVVDAKIKTVKGAEYFQKVSVDGISSEVLGTFLTCEGSHLLINPEVFGTTDVDNAENYTVKSAYGYIKIDGEPYMDGGAPVPVYLESIGEAYNIKVDGKYLTANAEIVDYLNFVKLHVVDVADAPSGNLSAWQIISREEMIAALKAATPENPVDASFFLNAGQIEVNANNNISSWTYIKNGEPAQIVTPDGGWFDHGNWDNKTTYAWCINETNENANNQEPVAGVDVVSQDVEGMPAGNYKVEYRVVNQNNTALVVKFNDAEGQPYEYEESDLWYSSAWDALAEHTETADFTVAADGKLSIKMEKTINPAEQNRFAFKSFSISYLGSNPDAVEVAVDENAPVVYYNMQGVSVANPSNGAYIKVQGKTASKVIIK